MVWENIERDALQAQRETTFHFLILNRFSFLVDKEGPPLLEALPTGNTVTSESSVAMMPFGLSQSFQPPWLRLGQWRTAKGEREDAWRGA